MPGCCLNKHCCPSIQEACVTACANGLGDWTNALLEHGVDKGPERWHKEPRLSLVRSDS